MKLNLTIEGENEVVLALFNEIGKGIGSIVQTVSIQPESKEADLVPRKEYAKSIGKSPDWVSKQYKEGKLKGAQKGRFIMINRLQAA